MDRPLRLLFVCTGNVCRSPMAEAVARACAGQLGVELEVRSAGTLGLEGHGAEPKVVAVCREIGLDLSEHVAQRMTDELAAWADHVVVMELVHAIDIQERHPVIGPERVHLLGRFRGHGDIHDPIGSWFKRPYRKARDLIAWCTEGVVGAVADGDLAPREGA